MDQQSSAMAVIDGVAVPACFPAAPVLIGSEVYRHSIYGRRHPLSIARVSATLDLIAALGWHDPAGYIDSPLASADALARFHTPEYIAAIMDAEATGQVAPEVRDRFNIGRNGNPGFPEIFRRPATAAGASDGFGLGVALGFEALDADPSLHRRYGFQDPPAWFTHRHKARMYTDGSVAVGAHRTMMATLLVSRMGWSEIAALDSTFTDVSQAMWALPTPRWRDVRPEPIDAARAAEGRALFAAACASCHGTYEGPDAAYPDLVVDAAEVGTDPVRAARLGPGEAEAINTLMADPDYPMTPTGGYLAPPLVGVWATAPYLHNGSIPDLAALLNPAERPALWRRLGSDPEHFDPDRVGWRFDTPAEPGDPLTVEGRRTYDTTREGLSNAGHTYGADLTEAERAALLEYLKTL